MNKQQITDLIRSSNHLSHAELAQLTGMSIGAIEHRRRRMGIRNLTINNNLGPATQPLQFLAKGRTRQEIIATYGSDSCLAKEYEGYHLFEQKNRFNESVFILLPEIKQEWKLQKRDHAVYSAPKTDGPYIMAQLPKFKGQILIAPLFDIHYGHSAHRHDKFLSYIRWIEETPNVYCIWGGDMMENALDDGRGMSYDQVANPHTQLDDMTAILARVAHKTLGATTGNHEWRSYKKTGIDIMQLLCERLQVPYFDGPFVMSVLANSHIWNFHVQHGFGNAQTKGGKMNMASRPQKFTSDIHFFLSGHVHDLVVQPETSLSIDYMHARLTEITQYTVVCPPFLGYWNTYAYRAGYPPPAHGGVSIELDANGDYRARLT
jgi:hypothetical protein